MRGCRIPSCPEHSACQQVHMARAGTSGPWPCHPGSDSNTGSHGTEQQIPSWKDTETGSAPLTSGLVLFKGLDGPGIHSTSHSLLPNNLLRLNISRPFCLPWKCHPSVTATAASTRPGAVGRATCALRPAAWACSSQGMA